MRQRIVTVDNFYDTPYQVRKQALSVDYNGGVSVDNYVFKEAVDKLSYIAGGPVAPVEGLPSGQYRCATQDFPVLSIDAMAGIDWIAVVYLTLPTQAEGEPALSVYRHVKTGSESVPNSTEMRIQGFNNLLEVKDSYVTVDGQNLSVWQAWFTVYQRWNRVVLFDASLWHRELAGFGDTINNCRLSQIFYLRNTGVPLQPTNNQL
jgi:hypothetical protein